MLNCMVVVRKEAGSDTGETCDRSAVVYLELVDPQTQELRERAYLCDDHASRLAQGQSLLVQYGKGDASLLHAFDSEAEE